MFLYEVDATHDVDHDILSLVIFMTVHNPLVSSTLIDMFRVTPTFFFSLRKHHPRDFIEM